MTLPAGATVSVGLPEPLRADAARLYLDAFAAKLGPILGRDARAEAFVASVLRPANAVVALDAEGALLGLAGFHDDTGGFVGGDFADMRRAYGLVGAAWRAPVFALFERSPDPGEMLMDGVVVAPDHRGAGVGGALLEIVASHARAAGASSLRLDVVDANPRARALYERKGFQLREETATPLMRPLFGFGAVATMTRPL
ncbi:MAG: GNAT family N-acetyltransferase [Pseudomonadota bacterium]